MRIKTTKKDIYAVTPTYLIITPGNTSDIAVVYFRKEPFDIDISKHKFKIEGIICDKVQLNNNDEIKAYFDLIASKGQKIKGSVLKKLVYHKIVEENLEASMTKSVYLQKDVKSSNIQQTVYYPPITGLESNVKMNDVKR